MPKVESIFKNYKDSSHLKEVFSHLENNSPVKIHFQNVSGSLFSFINGSLFDQTDKPFLLVLHDKEEAAYVFNELEALFKEDTVLFFPSSYRHPYEIEETNNANVLLRTEVLNMLSHTKKPRIVVTYSDALFEKVITRKALQKNTLKLRVGDSLSLDFINETLFEYLFKRVDFVTEPGEFSIRGGIVDIFSFSNDHPYRVEFFGDDIDSIRTFDIETQLSIDKKKTIDLIPNIANKLTQEIRESFFDYISSKTIVSFKSIDLFLDKIEGHFHKAEEKFKTLSSEIKHEAPSDLFLNRKEALDLIQTFSVLEFTSKAYLDSDFSLSWQSEPQPSFNKQFHLLADNFVENTQKGITNYLFCSSEKQIERFQDIFHDVNPNVRYQAILGTIHEGFIDRSQHLACYTDHQIFERYHKFRLKEGYSKKQAITLKELTALEVGDYVTHIDHGIGKFGGLMKIDNNGHKQEAIKLIYQNNDILYVSIHSLHKISKYNGKDGASVKVNKLGSPAWKNLKNKTKAKVKQIAFDLIQLYAKRKTQKGFSFTPDTYLQHELEASFMYEDTPDQLRATQSIKSDMESERVMDRLVCGDVGFGKTEVAIRAAFKAATDGKQVAVLVPTTVLAFQHFRSFSKRLEDMPVRIDYLNRFRTAKEKRLITEDLAEGKIDIIIGTHQLVNKNIVFNNLGLLIIDEEHKFGVNVKDKLKTLRENIDTLTLTATPIPRTLQFSLMAARDLSVMKTPPPNRQPVDTQVIGFNEETIRDAVSFEISRGGQVFFIHNRLENIKEVAGMIQRLVPDAKIAIGHGQMEGKKLEDLILAFMNGEFDVLVSTTIVESGLDVPNANTIMINQAQNFGLADLHQIRGRVGRSNRKAFCYLIAPPYSAMTEDARKRLQAIEQFSDLGSGFNIAMKDLEIRGAGNLLGAEQSGFISDIGFDTYQKILNEAIVELKENDFKELFDKNQTDSILSFTDDITIDTDFEILIPDDYVNKVEERLVLYNELNDVENTNQLEQYEQNLIDRFGPIPSEVHDLLQSIELKWVCRDLGFEKIVLKKGTMLCYFIKNSDSSYYQSGQFQTILLYIQQNPNLAQFKEKPQKDGLPVLMLRFDRVDSIKKALDLLKRFEVVHNAK